MWQSFVRWSVNGETQANPCFTYIRFIRSKSEYWKNRFSSTKNSRVHMIHEDVIQWKHFPRYWPFVRGIHRWPVNSPNKGRWRGSLMFSLICARINGWVNNREAGDLRRHSVENHVCLSHVTQREWYLASRAEFGMYCVFNRIQLVALCLHVRIIWKKQGLHWC